MELLEKIREKVEDRILKMNWPKEEIDLVSESALVDLLIDEVALEYATEYAREALELAYANAYVKIDIGYTYDEKLLKESILSENNLPKHI